MTDGSNERGVKNLFGKLLVVLIFIFSLLLFAMSGAVYMTHTNLRVKAEKVATDVEKANKVLDGTGSKPGLEALYKQYQEAITMEEVLRNSVVEALGAEVNQRKGECETYRNTVAEQEKNIDTITRDMILNTVYMMKYRIEADNLIVQVQNERNERIRAMHEYINNMNKKEDLTQQIMTLQKRERSLTEDQKGEDGN